jgi:hypothetical protein
LTKPGPSEDPVGDFASEDERILWLQQELLKRYEQVVERDIVVGSFIHPASGR